MIRRRYRIEASLATLKRFIEVAEKHAGTKGFVQRLTPDSNEEYYYVVLIAENEVHAHMKRNRFEDSQQLL